MMVLMMVLTKFCLEIFSIINIIRLLFTIEWSEKVFRSFVVALLPCPELKFVAH